MTWPERMKVMIHLNVRVVVTQSGSDRQEKLLKSPSKQYPGAVEFLPELNKAQRQKEKWKTLFVGLRTDRLEHVFCPQEPRGCPQDYKIPLH